MADDILFEFLHMEMVSHIYMEHTTREDIEKVQFISELYTFGTKALDMVHCR